ncbi:MAG: diguanylate cyclase domain-containing protein [Spirochaeta sp.]
MNTNSTSATTEKLREIIHLQTEVIRSGPDLGEIMNLVVKAAVSLVDADSSVIEFAEEDDMVYRAAAGIAESYLGLHLKRSSSMSGLCVQTNSILRCNDAEVDPRVDREACRRIGLRSMVLLPLQHDGEPIGVLKAFSARPKKFSDEDISLLEMLAEILNAAMYFTEKYNHNELFYRATHDSLTDLPNRALFMDRLRSDLAKSNRSSSYVGVLMIDMDDLKIANDTYGHRTGDAILKEFAQRCRDSTRTSDTIARLGGDEFGIILPSIESAEGIGAAIERLQESIAIPFRFEGRTYHLRASIGAAQFPYDGSDVEVLLDIADKRMYAHKRDHKQLVG